MQREIKSNAKLLIVEDDGIIAADIQSRLEKLGYGVVGRVPTADQAVELTRDHHPDLAIVDVQLVGRRDGTQLAEQLREEFDVPVILMSSYSNDGILERAKRAVPYSYLLKPFVMNELKGCIEMALTKHDKEKLKGLSLKQLTEVVRRLRKLEGEYFVCNECHAVHGTQTEWRNPEQFLYDQTGVTHTHGICPECRQIMMSERRKQVAQASAKRRTE